MMLLVAAAIPVSLSAESIRFTYSTKYHPAVVYDATIYFALSENATEAESIADNTVKRTHDEMDDLVIYANVISDYVSAISFTFTAFTADDGSGQFIPYTLTVTNVSDKSKSASGKAEGPLSAGTVTFNDLAGTTDHHQYSMDYTFADGAFDAVSNGLYSSQITVEVTMP